VLGKTRFYGCRGETKSGTLAAQEQALQTNYHVTKVLQTETDCKKFDETVEHIISACQILAEEQYIKRRNRLCAELSFYHMQGNRDKIRQRSPE
jgi:hypothetical protein